MELKIIQDNQNFLFNRKEVIAIVTAKIVPSNKEVMEALSKKFSVPEDAIKIKNILGKFGSQEFEINANVYTSKEELNKTEVRTKKERDAEKKAEADKIKAEAEARKKAKEEAEAAKAEAEKPAESKEESTEEKTE